MVSIMGKKMASSGFFSVLLEDQVVDVRNADLRREAGIDGAAACALAIHLLAGEFGVDEVFGLQAQALEIAAEQGA